MTGTCTSVGFSGSCPMLAFGPRGVRWGMRELEAWAERTAERRVQEQQTGAAEGKLRDQTASVCVRGQEAPFQWRLRHSMP